MADATGVGVEVEVTDLDALTGLPTFHSLAAALDEPMAAIFLDIDGFRMVNAGRGHLAGDEVLAKLGAWLANEASALHGQVFRVAGDEFLLLLRGRTLDEAAAIANRIVSTSLFEITLSAVVFLADTELHARLRDALEEFAEQLYRAELASGRTHGNVVVVETTTAA